MTIERPRIYWDSCVYISCLEKTPSRYPTLAAIVQLAKDDKIDLVISPLIFAEVAKINDASLTAAKQAETIRDFLENDYFKPRPFDRSIGQEAAEIVRTYGLKPPDAVHVAIAIRAKCDCLHTYDGEQGEPKKMLAFNGKIGSPALAIELPSIPALKPKDSQKDLF